MNKRQTRKHNINKTVAKIAKMIPQRPPKAKVSKAETVTSEKQVSSDKESELSDWKESPDISIGGSDEDRKHGVSDKDNSGSSSDSESREKQHKETTKQSEPEVSKETDSTDASEKSNQLKAKSLKLEKTCLQGRLFRQATRPEKASRTI